jgi:hypothetical protein
VGGQFCRRPMRAAFKRRGQGGVLLVCFFLAMDVRKKSRSDPQGRSTSSNRMRTLTPELIITPPAADNQPRFAPRDSERR